MQSLNIALLTSDEDPHAHLQDARDLYQALADLEAVMSLCATPESALPPPGSKGDAIGWAELAVMFTGGLPGILQVLRLWRRRRTPPRRLTIEIDGDKLTLDDVDPALEDELVRAWLNKHGEG